MPKLLLIDDDPDFTLRLSRGLQSDYQVTCLEEADAAALERLAKENSPWSCWIIIWRRCLASNSSRSWRKGASPCR